MKVVDYTKYAGRAERRLERHRENEKGKDAAPEHAHLSSLAENAPDRPDGGGSIGFRQSEMSMKDGFTDRLPICNPRVI